MQPPAQKEIRVEKSKTSFLIAGWISAVVVLAGVIWGGAWVWRRTRATSEQVRAKLVKESQARQQPAVVRDDAVPLDQPSDDRAQEPRPIPSRSEGREGKRSQALSRPPAVAESEPRALPQPPTAAEGKLDQLSIQRTVRSHMGEAKMCYEAGLKQQPELSGRVDVFLDVGPNGQVSSTKVMSSTLRNAKVENCLLQAIRRWRFPPPAYGESMGISYPFIFKP